MEDINEFNKRIMDEVSKASGLPPELLETKDHVASRTVMEESNRRLFLQKLIQLIYEAEREVRDGNNRVQ